jgi:hypothetical protein
VSFVAEGLDKVQDIGVELGRRRLLADDPGVDLAIRLLHQGFEGVELLGGQVGAMGVRERPQNEVRFPKSAMPGPELQPPEAGVVIDGHVTGDIERSSPRQRRNSPARPSLPWQPAAH